MRNAIDKQLKSINVKSFKSFRKNTSWLNDFFLFFTRRNLSYQSQERHNYESIIVINYNPRYTQYIPPPLPFINDISTKRRKWKSKKMLVRLSRSNNGIDCIIPPNSTILLQVPSEPRQSPVGISSRESLINLSRQSRSTRRHGGADSRA